LGLLESKLSCLGDNTVEEQDPEVEKDHVMRPVSELKAKTTTLRA